MRLLAPEGRFFSSTRGISRGLPQEGVLSPLLWLVHFNKFFEHMESPLGSGEVSAVEELVRGICLIHADDVTIASAHETATELVRLANRRDEQAGRALKVLRLVLGLGKCRNLVMSPGELIGTVFRRNNGLSRTVNKELLMRERRLGDLLETVEEEQVPWGVFPPILKTQLPYEYATSFRILGVTWDARMGFEARTEGVINRTMTRHGVMAGLARSTWGLEVGLLQSTHQALITSVAGYG